MRAKEYAERSQGFKAVMPPDWMRANFVPYFIITKDGTALDAIMVERYKFKKKLEYTKKMFLPDMTSQELADVEIDNFKSNLKVGRFEVSSNRPITVSGQQGFVFEYSFVTTDGLKINGIHYGFIYKEWVYRIRFEAAAQHYFNKYLTDFNRFRESFILL